MKHSFNPNWSVIEQFPNPDTDSIINEPMVYTASADFAKSFGGPLTIGILNKLERNELFLEDQKRAGHLNLIIDTRVHMLMKDQFPAIGGWHCDHFIRAHDGQPQLNKADPNSISYVVVLSNTLNGISLTEFITESVTAEINPENVWKSLHHEIENQKTARSQCHDGELIRFTQETPHRAMPAVCNGWRFFLRASFCYLKPKNQIRKQVQVYAPPDSGW